MMLIKASELEELYAEQLTLENDPERAFFGALFDCSPVDAVEVIRCKDCVFNESGTCDLSGWDADPDGFCSRGERRIDDGE